MHQYGSDQACEGGMSNILKIHLFYIANTKYEF